MPKGKPWSRKEEETLIQLVRNGKSVEVIAEALKKSEGAIFMKMQRLGLEVVVVSEKQQLTTTSETSQPLPEELPTVEDALKRLNAALVGLEQPGIDRKEIMRLKSVIHGLKMYKDFFADYAHYREIESELVELRKAVEEKNKTSAGHGERTQNNVPERTET